MQTSSNPEHSAGRGRQSLRQAPQRIALNETELSQRWGLSVKTLRRWRQDHLGPVFCKMGSRVTYLIAEVEAFERRVARNSTSTPAYQ